MVREKLPVPTLAGFMPLRAGVGLRTVTVLEAVAALEATLVAVIVIVSVLGLGSDDGAL
jgi:hypothetical protein